MGIYECTGQICYLCVVWNIAFGYFYIVKTLFVWGVGRCAVYLGIAVGYAGASGASGSACGGNGGQIVSAVIAFVTSVCKCSIASFNCIADLVFRGTIFACYG